MAPNFATSLNGIVPPDLVMVTDILGPLSCCYYLDEELPCDAATPNYTYSTLVGTCDDGEIPEECIAAVEERWLYESCTGCETLVSTSQFHSDGTTAFWYDCCWYEVPAGPVVDSSLDNVPALADVHQVPIPCDVALANTMMLWTNCLDASREIIWDCTCTIDEPYAIGTTINGLTGTDAGGLPISPDDCWELIAPINLPPSDVVCDEPVIVKCGEDPCL